MKNPLHLHSTATTSLSLSGCATTPSADVSQADVTPTAEAELNKRFLTPEFQFSFEVPQWLAELEKSVNGVAKLSDDEKIEFTIHLALENVKRGSGGPFGAAIFDIRSGHLVCAGVNLVVSANQSWAHAEMTAIARAQQKLNSLDLSHYMLVSSCEPCAMCYGATPWSGVKILLFGAPGSMARQVGFDEGDKPANWQLSLKKRGIDVRGPMLEEKARLPFELYKGKGGIIY